MNNFTLFASIYFVFLLYILISEANLTSPKFKQQITPTSLTSKFTMGNSAIFRAKYDIAADRSVINAGEMAPDSGIIKQWILYAIPKINSANSNQEIFLQIWRPSSTVGLMFTLISERRLVITRIRIGPDGSRVIFAPSTSNPQRIQRGDVIGIRHPSTNPIPYDLVDCDSKVSRTYYVKDASTVAARPGDKVYFTAETQCKAYSLSAEIVRDTDGSFVGYDFSEYVLIDKPVVTTIIQAPTVRAKTSGEITAWDFYSTSSDPVRLQVWRNVTAPVGAVRYKLVSETFVAYPRVNASNYVTVAPNDRVGFLPGDVFGITFTGLPNIPYRHVTAGRRCLHPSLRGTAEIPGVSLNQAQSFTEMTEAEVACRRYAVAGLISTPKPEPENTFEFGGNLSEYFRSRDIRSGVMTIPQRLKAIPRNGTLVGWAFYTTTDAPIYLQIWRPVQEFRFKLVGESNVTALINIKPLTVNRVELPSSQRISVKRGDFLGFYAPRKHGIPYYGKFCSIRYFGRYNYRNNGRKPGETYVFREMKFYNDPCRIYALNAQISVQ